MLTQGEILCHKGGCFDPITVGCVHRIRPPSKSFCSSTKQAYGYPTDTHGRETTGKRLLARRSWSSAFGLLSAVSLLAVLAGCPAPPPPATNTIGLQPVASGLTAPVAMTMPNDGTGRKFIVDQTGKIFILDANNNMLATPFLDVSAKLVTLMTPYDERGLLGLAFHPNYAANGRFFIKYNAPKGPNIPADFDDELRISEFQVSASDPNLANPAGERILLAVPKPQFNHNGGNILFGPDGFLYIGLGDGGGADDVGVGHTPNLGNGQDTTRLLGKLLRIDVNNGVPYAIPPDNPFVNQAQVRPEIWAFGLRNPYSFSFDTATGQLFLGDVGQDLFEEVDIITKGGNFGWNIKEGFSCFNSTNPTSPLPTCATVGAGDEPLINPIFDYAHVDAQGNPFGIAVIGGFVYRGAAIPGLAGNYVFGDLSTSFLSPDGSVFAATQQTDGTWTFRQLQVAGTANNRLGLFLKGFAQDDQGELYLLASQILGPTGTTGQVLRIVPSP
jgi:glucose/arabinose dehydrogenase